MKKKVVYMMRALYSELYGNSCIKILHFFSLFHGKKKHRHNISNLTTANKGQNYNFTS